MKEKLLEATRGYFKDDESAETAIDIILEIIKDSGYRITTNHIGRAVALAKEMGKECIVVIGAGEPVRPPTTNKDGNTWSGFSEINPPILTQYNYGYESKPDKHTHKRKSSREI